MSDRGQTEGGTAVTAVTAVGGTVVGGTAVTAVVGTAVGGTAVGRDPWQGPVAGSTCGGIQPTVGYNRNE